MDLFISWSEEDVGLPVVQAFAEWLPKVVPGVQPWISPNIPAGVVGVQELLDRLRACDGGLVILTPASQISPWVLFESGAFAIKRCLFPYRVGLPGTGMREPFKNFQYKRSSEDDTFQLVHNIAMKAADIAGYDRPKPNETRERYQEMWNDLRQVLDVVLPEARKYLTRYAQYGEGGYLATLAERKAAQVQEWAETQELRAEGFRTLLFSLLRHEPFLMRPGSDLKLLKDEMAAFRRIAEEEAFDDFAEGEMFEGEAIDEQGINLNE